MLIHFIFCLKVIYTITCNMEYKYIGLKTVLKNYMILNRSLVYRQVLLWFGKSINWCASVLCSHQHGRCRENPQLLPYTSSFARHAAFFRPISLVNNRYDSHRDVCRLVADATNIHLCLYQSLCPPANSEDKEATRIHIVISNFNLYINLWTN